MDARVRIIAVVLCLLSRRSKAKRQLPNCISGVERLTISELATRRDAGPVAEVSL